MVRGQRIGEAAARFTGSGLSAADRRLQAALLDAIAGAAGLAALLALVTGLVVARRITRPVARLIAVTRAMTAGDRSARAGPVRAPAELRELAAAFDQMAGTLDRQEQIRRNLVAAIAHELRTPIAVLQAGHEALLDGVTEPTAAELTSLRDEVLRLARMVGDLQDLAAADAAALHLTRQTCDLADLAAAAAGSLARRFDAAGIAVDRQLAAAPVLADPRWLHQVITNLLSNALKFTPSGGRVTISTRQEGPEAVLEVTDTGSGIPADELPRVFDRFWRGRQAAQTSGSGIGLSVAADLARAHGGRLTASQPARARHDHDAHPAWRLTSGRPSRPGQAEAGRSPRGHRQHSTLACTGRPARGNTHVAGTRPRFRSRRPRPSPAHREAGGQLPALIIAVVRVDDPSGLQPAPLAAGIRAQPTTQCSPPPTPETGSASRSRAAARI